MPRYAEVAQPLCELTRKGHGNVVQWGAKQERSIVALKRKLAKLLVLIAPDVKKSFVLRTDDADSMRSSHALTKGR